jgi:predicted RNase H-like nuclease (RuvC/YqgF family)
MELPKDLKDKVWNYCRLNDITDVNGFIIKTLKKGLDVEVYGLLGKTLNEGEKDLKTGGIEEKRVEIEVIREIRVEVPVEVIKEVPVDRVVEKIIYTTDDIQINELGGKIAELEQEISTKITEIGRIREEFSTKTTENESFFQNEMSKKNKELDELRRTLDDPVTNNNINMLQETLQKLRKEMSNKDEKIKELEKINNNLQNTTQNNVGAIFLRGSNLNNIL